MHCIYGKNNYIALESVAYPSYFAYFTRTLMSHNQYDWEVAIMLASLPYVNQTPEFWINPYANDGTDAYFNSQRNAFVGKLKSTTEFQSYDTGIMLQSGNQNYVEVDDSFVSSVYNVFIYTSTFEDGWQTIAYIENNTPLSATYTITFSVGVTSDTSISNSIKAEVSASQGVDLTLDTAWTHATDASFNQAMTTTTTLQVTTGVWRIQQLIGSYNSLYMINSDSLRTA